MGMPPVGRRRQNAELQLWQLGTCWCLSLWMLSICICLCHVDLMHLSWQTCVDKLAI